MFGLQLHYQCFPSTADLANLKLQVEKARLLLCDATDGRIKLKKVRVSYGGASEEEGDVWLMLQPGRSFSNVLGGHVTLFPEGSGYSGSTLAHELGHQLLGLGDSYYEQINAGTRGCGRGANFDSPMDLGPEDNTIMEEHRPVCRLSDGRSLGELNPDWQTTCDPAIGCATPCSACSSLPDPPADLSVHCSDDFTSELTVGGLEGNFDPTSGNGGVLRALRRRAPDDQQPG